MSNFESININNFNDSKAGFARLITFFICLMVTANSSAQNSAMFLIATLSSSPSPYPFAKQEGNPMPLAELAGSQACLTGNRITKQLMLKQGLNTAPDNRYLDSFYTYSRQSCERKVQATNIYSHSYFMMIYYISTLGHQNYQKDVNDILSFYYSRTNFDQVIAQYGYKIPASLCITQYKIIYTPAYQSNTSLIFIQKKDYRAYQQIIEQTEIQIDNLLPNQDWFVKVKPNYPQNAAQRHTMNLFYIDIYKTIRDKSIFEQCCLNEGLRPQFQYLDCIQQQNKSYANNQYNMKYNQKTNKNPQIKNSSGNPKLFPSGKQPQMLPEEDGQKQIPSDDKKQINLGLIIGVSIGSFVALVIVIAIFIKFCLCRNKDGNEKNSQNKYGQKQHQPGMTDRNLNGVKDCAICLETGCNALLPCQHYFHYRCILDWLVRKRKCPLCRERTKVTDIRTFLN